MISKPLNLFYGTLYVLVFVLFAGLLFCISEPFTYLIMMVVIIILLSITVLSYLVMRKIKQCIFVSILLLIQIILFFNINVMDSLWEQVYFKLHKQDFLLKIDKLPQTSQYQLAVFTLYDEGFLGLTNLHLLVYDESHEMNHSSKSIEWIKKAKGTDLELGLPPYYGFHTQFLEDNFYLVHISI